ncbi:NAD-dependent epimerase/dehydratase family protein [Neorhizobium sp. NPDC001467]|uniref:polysaccharide biosynthesis C-terminal domain-containing protein n=1 Tax=Neorhizobium sp. NPDC001467 TaxID=3390595 RepID=UPI003D01F4C5
MKKVVITGAAGLIGWHAAARLHAVNCAARFNKRDEEFEVVAVDRAVFSNRQMLVEALADADVILHFAGVNRASDDDVERGNPDIAANLIEACRAAGCDPHIVYANSTHYQSDTPYGRSKRLAGELLAAFTPRFTNLILPHIFGECARPYYNNVTATFIKEVISDRMPDVNPEGRVHLLHAGAAAQIAIDAGVTGQTGLLQPEARTIGVPDLLAKIVGFHQSYNAGVYPDVRDPFDLALFNSYRAALYPEGFPRVLKLNTDARGTLFEAVKGGGGGQTFLSWTEPGVTRGEHFHLDKVERFLVLKGEAVIRLRKVLTDEVWTYPVSGDAPVAVDMPTLHTHSIENVGNEPLLTLFWTNEIFDPANPDTFADPVLGKHNV